MEKEKREKKYLEKPHSKEEESRESNLIFFLVKKKMIKITKDNKKKNKMWINSKFITYLEDK